MDSRGSSAFGDVGCRVSGAHQVWDIGFRV